MERPRIIILCGGRFAFSSIQLLIFEKFLCGCAVGTQEKDSAKILQDGLKQSDIPFLRIPDASSVHLLIDWMNELKPDAVFSICFPFRLPVEVLNTLPGRFINFHTGPLPEYRGAMPIYEVLRNGENKTAVTAHLMDEKFDEGNLIFTEEVPINPFETFGSLAVRLSERCSLAVANMAQMLEFGSQIPNIPQNMDAARYYPAPDKFELTIRWSNMQAEEICRLINACNPWNLGADTSIENHEIKIISATFYDEEHNRKPGEILSRNESGINVACIENTILSVRIISSESGIVSPEHFPSYLQPYKCFSS